MDPPDQLDPADAARRRRAVVDRLRAEGITDELVLAAMASVPRERFAPPGLRDVAVDEMGPLPIDGGQTMSALGIVAAMTAALELTGRERVLEVGTGSGYAAAVLACCADEVVSVEYDDDLAHAAAAALHAGGYDVDVRRGDGALGAPDRAPFDAVSVTAMASGGIPPALIEQLHPDGVLVCPVGENREGELVRYRHGRTEALLPVRFVPLRRGL